ncbi:100k protein [Fowl aviadenovirus D]|uniref:Shutoff protein n=1 Tax=Fowl aviadenovirus D TaxID=190064 RepID=A0A6M3MZ27_9ADEN|nr:100k protein [Fowl aviadenovirus D]
MQTAREGKAAILNLVVNTAKEKIGWQRFVDAIQRYVAEAYGAFLALDPDASPPRRESDHAVRVLIDALGEERAVLAAYRVAEDLLEDKEMPKESQDKEPLSENEELANEVEGDEAEEEEEDEEDEEEEEDSSPSTVLENERIQENGEPDHDPNGGEGAADSDADSGYYSADGGQLGSKLSDSEHENDAERQVEVGIEDESASGRHTPGTPDSDRDHQEQETSIETKHVDPVSTFKKCFERQAALLTGALKDSLPAEDADEPVSVSAVQYQLERFVFNPDPRVPPEHREVRYNFYPPFMRPKAIANYHIFAVTAPIPASCKANRSGSKLLESCRQTATFKRLPRWRINVQFDDGLGEEVIPVTELSDAKLVPLQEDISRLQWAKMRGEHIRFFSYPSLHMPPKISRMLMETLLQPFADENDKGEGAKPCVSDEELRYIVDPDAKMRGEELYKAMQRRRTIVTMAVRFTALLELMERVLREPSSVKKAQEVLHHTLHHGFVAQVRETAKVNLSNYATYHGITYNDPLNNCTVAKLFEGRDKEDYVLDSIYLFLVLNWQTAMGMWQQAIDDTTIQIYTEAFTRQRRAIYALTSVTEVSKAIVDLLMDGDRLTEEMRKALPNFITQSQLSDFRHFLTERSNVPTMAAPFYPSDFIPLAFRQSAPLLWDHVYLLQAAYFLMNHGGYLWEPSESDAESPQFRAYCPCNLCSPHRMLADNVALHNEVLAIGTFEIRSADGKTFKLTPELWANAYLDKFVADDFHPFTVFHYSENRSSFGKNYTACVTESPEILSLIRQIQASREEFLLTRGKGVYKDPQTGETLATSAASVGEARPGAARGAYLPSAPTGASGGTPAPQKPPRAIRAADQITSGDSQHTRRDYGEPSLSIPSDWRYGSENARREDQSNRRATPAVGRDRRSLPYRRAVRGTGSDRVRRRNSRKPGYGGEPEYHLGGGGGGGLRGSGEGEYTSVEGGTSKTPLRILPREDSHETSAEKEIPQ